MSDTRQDSMLARAMQQAVYYLPANKQTRPYYFTASYWMRLDSMTQSIQRILELASSSEDIVPDAISLTASLARVTIIAWACYLILSGAVFSIVEPHDRHSTNRADRQPNPIRRQPREALIAQISDVLKSIFVTKHPRPLDYLNRVWWSILLALAHDVLSYLLLSYTDPAIWKQMMVYIVVSLTLSPFNALCTQNMMLQHAQSWHSSRMSLLSLYKVLLFPSLVSAGVKALNMSILAMFINTSGTNYWRTHSNKPRTALEMAYPDTGPILDIIQYAFILSILLAGPATVALIRAEAAIIPASAVTILPVDRAGTSDFLHSPRASATSLLSKSAALAVWSWRSVSWQRTWASIWPCLPLCALTLILAPERSP